MDYAVPVFHYSLPKYLMHELERIQKRAKSIICPGHSYHEALDITNFKGLATHHDGICETLVDTIVNDNNHRLYKFITCAARNYLFVKARAAFLHATVKNRPF